MPTLNLTSQERSALRAAAHPLRPVVWIGDKGLTPAVLKEIDAMLTAHALIKVRVAGHEREEREAMLATICTQLACAAVHHLGKTLILHRPMAAPAAETTRAVRKATEPYTPKKLAAAGKTRGKTPRAPSATPKKPPSKPPRATARPAKPASRSALSRSTLSLRAGARRGAR